MSTLKTNVDSERILDFLKKNFAADILSLTRIKEGETSQAFSFSSKGDELVVRIHSKKDGFEKDDYAYKHFGSEDIPIPKMLHIGQLNGNLYYAITEKVKGKILDHFAKDAIYTVIPAMIKSLDAIHHVDISDTTHFGDWDSQGKARKTSWRAYLFQLVDDFSSFEDKGSILKRDVIETIFKRFTELVDFCPNIRHLVHGDFGFNNVCSDGKSITGIFDWELSKYGDFLYDVAWLSFWETEIDYAAIFLEHYGRAGISVPNSHERILSYKLHFGLEALKFLSDSGQEENYHWTKERLLALV